MRQRVHWSVLLILLLSASFPGFAAHSTPGTLPYTQNVIDDTPYQMPEVAYVADAGNRLTAEGIATGDQHVLWQQVPAARTSFGYTSTPYWFRLDVHNPFDQPQERFLVLPLPYMDDIQIWELAGDRILNAVQLGENLPYHQRLVDHPWYILPVTLAPGSSRTWLFRLQTQGSIEFPLGIWKPKAFFEEQVAYQQGLGLFYGAMLLGLVLTLLLWLRLRRSLYGFYVLFSASALVLMAAQHGTTFRYLWPDHPHWQNRVLFLGIPLCTLGALEFSRRFLRLDKISPMLNQILKILSILVLVHIALLPWLPSSWANREALLLGMVTALMLLIAGPIALVHRQPGALYYNIGWFFLELGVLISGLQKFTLLPATHFTINAILYGLAAQAAFLTFGLVDRIYHERTRRIQAEKARRQLEAERADDAARHLADATHDPVTGLPNRTFLENHLRTRLRQGRPLGLLMIRLERFRDIDRTLGQVHADTVIRLAAERLILHLRGFPNAQWIEESTQAQAARVNGSTFAVVFSPEILSDIRLHALPLLEAMRDKLDYQGMPLDLDPRMGVALAPDHADDATGLIRRGLIALDMTHRHTQPVCIYDPLQDPYSSRRLTLLSELEDAIHTGQLQLHLQPQLSLHEGRIEAFEALVRWLHPVHGQIPPMEFIRLAEDTGLIHPLTRWVIREAIRLLGQLELDGYPNTRIAVNISAEDLIQPDFAADVLACLADADVPCSRLTLEITETAAMRHPEDAIEILRELASAGVSLSLDDYGAGYSSLLQIKRLPLHEIKIDRSLIADITQTPETRLIVETTLNMCHSLGYQVVAEGIEDEDTLALLAELRCDLAQGYHIARPMPYPFLIPWLREFEGAQPGPADASVRLP